MSVRVEKQGTARERNQGEAGFGLPEILIGSALIVTLASTAVYYSGAIKNVSSEQVSDRFNCSAHLTSTLARMVAEAGPRSVEKAYYRDNQAPTVTDPHPNLLSAAVYWPASVPRPIRWDTTVVAQQRTYVGNGPMIDGAVRVMNAFYNDAANNCTNFVDFPNVSALANSSSQILNKTFSIGSTGVPTTSMRLRLYDLSTGLPIAGCTKGIWLHPRGINPGNVNVDAFSAAPNSYGAEAPHGTAPAVIAFKNPDATSYRDNLGIILEMRTSYKDTTLANGNAAQAVTKSCDLTQRFAYDRDLLAPVRPSVRVDLTEPAASSDAHRVAGRLTITSVKNVGQIPERGSVFLCRDVSRLPTTDNTIECYSNPGGAGRGPGHQFDTAYGRRNSAPVPFDSTVWTGSAASGTAPNKRPVAWAQNKEWVPCEKVTMCGTAPSGASSISVPAPGDPNEVITITNDYVDLRSECIARVEVAVVDTAGNLHVPNRQNVADITFYGAQIDQVASSTGIVVPRPTCGAICVPNAYWAGNSYYMYNGCCVGVGCNSGIGATTRRDVSGVLTNMSVDPVNKVNSTEP